MLPTLVAAVVPGAVRANGAQGAASTAAVGEILIAGLAVSCLEQTLMWKGLTRTVVFGCRSGQPHLGRAQGDPRSALPQAITQ